MSSTLGFLKYADQATLQLVAKCTFISLHNNTHPYFRLGQTIIGITTCSTGNSSPPPLCPSYFCSTSPYINDCHQLGLACFGLPSSQPPRHLYNRCSSSWSSKVFGADPGRVVCIGLVSSSGLGQAGHGGICPSPESG